MKARVCSKDAKVPLVLEPCQHRELNVAMAALAKWTFDPEMKGDDRSTASLTVRTHFRTR